MSSDHVNSPLLGISPKGDILPLHNHLILLFRKDLHLERNLRLKRLVLRILILFYSILFLAKSDCTVPVR